MAMVTVEDGNVLVSIPMSFKTVSGRRHIVLEEQLRDVKADSMDSNCILMAFARAYKWTRMLDAGGYKSLSDLAAAIKVDRPRMVKIMRLATLSPRIVQMVLRGATPDDLSVEKLWSIRSDIWSEQEREIGMG